MIQCQKCGCQNQLGHLYCMRCRTKLDLKTHLDTQMLKMTGQGGLGLKHVSMLLVVAAVVLCGLMLWPSRFDHGGLTSDEFRSACRKINILDVVPQPAPQVLSENEMNAYMAAVVARAKKTTDSGLLSSRIRSVGFSFKNNLVVVRVDGTRGPLVLGPLNLGCMESTCELTGVPAAGEGGFRFHLKHGRIGHLPLPRFLCYTIFSEMETFFSRLGKERAFLARIGGIEVREGEIVVSMGR